MATPIGPADEFWRLRLLRVDATDEPEFEWRDDLLYREPPAPNVGESSRWSVQAVSIEDETTWLLAEFDDEANARDFLESASEDLRDMTSRAFEQRYSGDSVDESGEF